MNKTKTPLKSAKKPRKEDTEKYTKEDLIDLVETVKKLKREEIELDKELAEMNRKGVKITDSVLIMNALHEFNETRDALVNVFEFLGNITQSTSADLHKKYNVPLE